MKTIRIWQEVQLLCFKVRTGRAALAPEGATLFALSLSFLFARLRQYKTLLSHPFR